MTNLKLYMLLLGCRPIGRHTEQHDVLFAIGLNPKDLVPQILAFWPEAKGVIHVDAWREVKQVDGFDISIEAVENKIENPAANLPKLFFINLGGYKQNEFEEYHYKMLSVGTDKAAAIMQAKKTAFYKHTGFVGAPSHVDDKYGVDVDDIHEIKDILPKSLKLKYSIAINRSILTKEDEMQLGYFKLNKL